MRTPSKLRLIECDLPDELEANVAALEEDFDATIQPYFDKLIALAPDILAANAALDAQIAIREELVSGAPVASLASLAAIAKSTKISDPSKLSIREDERKLGAAGIAMINGRMFKMLSGDEISSLRRLWFLAGKDYDAFILAAENIFAQPRGTFSFYEYNTAKESFPLINRSFDQLFTLTGYKPSVFEHGVFWNGEVAALTANRLKLNASGFTEVQTTNIFSDDQPNADFDFSGSLASITSYLKTLNSILFLQPNDPLRQPAWQMEFELIFLAINDYLKFRLAKNTSSSTLNEDYYRKLLAALRPQDLKELFEERPELLNLQLPQSLGELTTLITKASSNSSKTLINSYMLSLPQTVDTQQIQLECRLFNLGLSIWRKLRTALPERAPSLEALLQELIKNNAALTDLTPFCRASGVDPQDYEDIFSDRLPPRGTIANAISEAGRKTDGALLNQALAANADSSKYSKSSAQTSSGAGQGLPTEDTFSTLVARRVSWKDNFVDCSYNAELSKSVGTETVVKVVDSATGEDLASTKTPSKPTPEQAAEASAKRAVGMGKTDAEAIPLIASGLQQGFNKTLEQAQGLARAALKKARANAVLVERKALETTKATQRREVVIQQGKPYNSFKGTFEMGSCTPQFARQIGDFLERNRKALEKWLVRVLNVIRELIVYIQDKIDSFILAVQLALDTVLSKMEKLLSLDVNLSGKFGFENSLIKCSFGLDFGFKLNLMDLLLAFLDGMFSTIGLPIRATLDLFQDFIAAVFCIPIRMLEELLGSSSKLLGAIGCTVKDFRLPAEVTGFMRTLLGSFELRSIVLRQSTGDWLDMTLRLKLQKNEFQGLAQFAALCSKPTVQAAMASLSKQALADLPIAVGRTDVIAGQALPDIGGAVTA